MKRKNFIQVFEYGSLKIGTDGFTKNHLDSLVKFNDKNGNKYFTPIYNGYGQNKNADKLRTDYNL